MKPHNRGKKAKTGAEVFEGDAATPALELMDELFTPPLGEATIGVVRSVDGVCPLGFRPGKTWSVERDGHLLHPLCRPAVEAISKALLEFDEEDIEAGISCRCPLGDRNMVFSVETAG